MKPRFKGRRFPRRTMLMLWWALILGMGLAGGEFVRAAEPVSITGITEAVRDITISAEVSGLVAVVPVREGQFVKKGQILMELDHELEALEVRRRKLMLDSQVELTAAAERAEILSELLELSRSLYQKTKSISLEELRKKELEHILAVMEVERLELAEKREQIEYYMALETLEQKRLKAPVSGIVVNLYVEPGENCELRQPLVQLVDISRCRLVCNVDEHLGLVLKRGKTVTLRLTSEGGLCEKQGNIIFVSPIVDAASELLVVKAEFENSDGKIRPGVSGTLFLPSPL